MKHTLKILILVGLFYAQSASALWYDSNYSFCRKLTMQNAQVATTTTLGYPILATTTLSTLSATTTGGNVEFLDGRDIVFTSGTDCTTDGGSLLDYYLEDYATSTGAIVAWVESNDMSSTTDKSFLMYYGNSSGTDQTNEAGVYNSTYAGVWDMSEDPTGTIFDSTSNNNDGTSVGSMTSSDQVAGQINGAIDFDGSDDQIDVPDSSSLKIADNFTIRFWYNMVDNTAGGFPSIINKSTGSSSNNGYNIFFDSGEKLYFKRDGAFVIAPSSTISPVWHDYVITYDGTDVKIYKDTVEVVSTARSYVTDTKSAVTELGGMVSDNQGELDNIHIRNISIHPMDILTDYNMSSDNTSFLTFGAEETETAGDTNATGNVKAMRGKLQIKRGRLQIK